MAFRTTVLLFSFVVLSLSAELYTHTGNVSLATPLTFTLGPFNLRGGAKLNLVSSSQPINFCIVHAAYGLPGIPYNRTDCIAWGNSTDNTINFDVQFRVQAYTVGVYFAAGTKKEENTTVTVTLNGEECTTGYWNGVDCIKATPLESGNTTFVGQFSAGETKFWSYEAPSYVGSFKLRIVEAEGNALSAEDTELWARLNAAPSKDFNDAIDNNGNLTFVSPRPGTWLFAVHSAKGGKGQFRLFTEVCSHDKAGEGCSIVVPDQVNNTAVVVKQVPLYWRVRATPEKPVWVSITVNNATDMPSLWASQGNIPTNFKNTDLRNCNSEYCYHVRAIKFNVTSEQDWFIGVQNVHSTGNVTFAIWWDSACVTNCTQDNHGSCQPDGTCDCEIDYEGLSCSISKGLGPQYIVLIIIASLVVASAIIGFVAWAYMRRKRANYEIVS